MFRLGKRAGGQACRLFALEGSGAVGFTTSRKLGSTPMRNRAKRRAREGWRRHARKVRGNLDYVVLVTPQGASAPFEALVEELGTLIDAVHDRWAAE